MANQGFLLIALAVLCTVVQYSECVCTYRDVRLYNASTSTASNSSGMVQICDSQGRWTAVCDYRWRQDLSVKVCTTLGHVNPKPITTINSRVYWSRFGFVSLSSTNNCPASRALARCLSTSSFRLNSFSYCNKNRDTINIECDRNTSGCTSQQIRLYNSVNNVANNNTGMLQICNTQGEWTAVCDYSFGCNEAMVACRQLGYTNPRASYSYNGGPWTEFGFGPYSYCSTTANSLFNCISYSTSYRTSSSYCNPFRDTVLLNCTEKKNNSLNTCSPNYSIRLVNGSTPEEGRVELCYNSVWTTVCGVNYISQKTASTLCNQLGYQGNDFATPIYDGTYGISDSTEYASRLYCRNAYDAIRYCSITVAGGSGNGCTSPTLCTGNQLGLKCYKPQNCNEGDIRLVDGVLDKEGRLEVCANGVWGSVCSNSFSLSAAYVACKQAGHTNTNGAIIDKYGRYGTGSGPIVYNAINCFGHEDTIATCSKVIYPNFYCAQNRVIGLRCLDMCKNGDIRLIGGSHSFEGTVEICVDQSWSLIAEHGWDNTDARIVCKQIGGYNYSAGIARYNSYYGKPKRAIIYSNIYCRGNEKELTDCTHHTFDFEFGRTYNATVAGVDCGLLSTPSVTPLTTPTLTRNTIPTIQRVPSTTVSLFIQASQGPQTGGQRGGDSSSGEHRSVFISGILFFAIGISVLLIAIIIMIFVVLRMKKLSLKNNNKNTSTISAVQRMSTISEASGDIKPSPSTMSYDEELLS